MTMPLLINNKGELLYIPETCLQAQNIILVINVADHFKIAIIATQMVTQWSTCT